MHGSVEAGTTHWLAGGRHWDVMDSKKQKKKKITAYFARRCTFAKKKKKTELISKKTVFNLSETSKINKKKIIITRLVRTYTHYDDDITTTTAKVIRFLFS